MAHTGLYFQVTALEQKTLEVLSLLLSMRNTFVPINRIPPEIISLIPDYWENEVEKGVIALTHVCHGWREIFIHRSSLWTHLNCKDAEKTRVYIERSRSRPLEISLTRSGRTSYCNDVLLMAVPYISRLGSLTIHVPSKTLPHLFHRFPFPAPFLTELKIYLHPINHDGPDPVIPNTIFPDHLSPLRRLSLSNIVTDLPWRNLSSLTVFEFHHVRSTVDLLFTKQLLDFFESTPLLRRIILHNSIPKSSVVPSGRVIPLPNLEKLTIDNLPSHSTFLGHLSIPTDVSLDLGFSFSTDGPLIPTCLPGGFGNLGITTINLHLNESRIRLNGPSGELRIYRSRGYWDTSSLFQSLGKFDLSKTRRLSVTGYSPPVDEIENSPIFHSFLLMNNLRTLALIETGYLPFIHALNPEQNKSRTVLCPGLEDLVIFISHRDLSYLEELTEMASNRVKKFSKLSSITFIRLLETHQYRYEVPDIFSLRKHVSRVEYKYDASRPDWNAIFGGRGDGDYDGK